MKITRRKSLVMLVGLIFVIGIVLVFAARHHDVKTTAQASSPAYVDTGKTKDASGLVVRSAGSYWLVNPADKNQRVALDFDQSSVDPAKLTDHGVVKLRTEILVQKASVGQKLIYKLRVQSVLP